jgi:hypothetical protein
MGDNEALAVTVEMITEDVVAWKRMLLLLKVQFDACEIQRGEPGSTNDVAGALLYALCDEWDVM